MKSLLVTTLVLLILRCIDGQMAEYTGQLRPCDAVFTDNLSCLNPSDPLDTNDCLNRTQLCDGVSDCLNAAFPTQIDEGIDFNFLNCTSGNPGTFLCPSGDIIPVAVLCDGIANCTGGADEITLICENKCLFPYYGGCSITRECVTSEFGRICLLGYTANFSGNPSTAPCIAEVFLSLDASVYNAAEGVPTVQVCVSGSVGTGNLSDIDGQSFEVNLTLSDGTALGGAGQDFTVPAIPNLTFDSTNLLVPQCVDITIIDDTFIEPTETFDVSLTLLTDNTDQQVTLNTSSATVFIAADDECPDPAEIMNGMVTFTGNLIGDTATYACNSGFELIGDTVTTCTQVSMNSAAFSPAPPVCRPLCLDPAPPGNGAVTFTGNSIGDTATYTCNTGFELIGNASRTCTQADVNSAAFEPARPHCRPLCPLPPDPDNGMVTCTGNSLDDTCTFTCNSNFELFTPFTSASARCIYVDSSTARFTPTPFPVCRPLCPDPTDIVNGMVTFNGNSVGDTATYTCNSGFELIGNASTTCTQVDMNSTAFLPAAPMCRPGVFLTLDASIYNATESVPTVQVCVLGSVATGNPSDIAGQSFEVNLALSDGTALGGVGLDWEWTSAPASLDLTFDSTNLLVPQCVNITINDDSLTEPTETINVFLTLVTDTTNQRVTMNTSSATIFITDNDGSIFESAANEFFLGFSQNFALTSLFLFVTTTEPSPVNFSIDTLLGFSFTGVATNNATTRVSLPNSLFQVSSTQTSERHKGIRVRAEVGRRIVVYGLSYHHASSDAFLALPCNRLPVTEYEYYVISFLPRSTNFPSTYLLVGCEDNTTITTPSSTLILNQMETYVMESLSNDLTGTRIVSDKPISLFSNHECALVPSMIFGCDYLTEQVPPTVTWGHFFLAASFLGRTSGEIIRILASTDATDVTVNCTTMSEPLSFTLSNASNFEQFRINADSFCSIESNNAILVFEFSLGGSLDGFGDPFATMLPPVEQYSNSYVFNSFSQFRSNFITIHVAPEFFQSDYIFVDNMSLESSSWTEVYCTGSVICGFMTQIPLLPGDHHLFHQDTNASVGVTVYGFDIDTSYGFPGGLQQIQTQGSAVQCPDPADIRNGMRTFTGNSVGDTATYTCNSGFELIGNPITTCTLINANSAAFSPPPPPLCRQRRCSNDITEDIRGSYEWQETIGGDTQQQICVFGGSGMAVRNCSVEGIWEDPDLSQCNTIFNVLENITITGENVENVTQMTASAIEATVMEDQNTGNLDVVISIITGTTVLITNDTTITEATTENIVLVVDAVQDWAEAVVQQRSSLIVQTFENFTSEVVQQEEFLNITVIAEETVLQAQRISTDELQVSGITLTVSSTGERTAVNITRDDVVQVLPPDQIVSVVLPSSLFTQIDSSDTLTGIVFTLYETAILFPNPDNITVGSPVVGADIAGVDTLNLTEPFTILVRLNNASFENPRCASYDFNALGEGIGNWTTDGCTTDRLTEEVVECKCNHLTNFGVLVDISGRRNRRPLPPAAEAALSAISIIGSIFSLIGCTLVVVTHLGFQKLRKRYNSKFHVQLSIAIFGMMFAFVVGIQRTETIGGCAIISLLVHYFSMASVMWMAAEAWLMFQKLVIVYVRITTRYIVVVSLICWLIPIPFVVVPVAVDYNFVIHANYCFISNIAVFFGAFFGPVIALMVFNTVVFVIVIVVLIKHTRGTKNQRKDSVTIKSTLQSLIRIVGVVFLFGLTWLFGAFAVTNKSRLSFLILFVLFSSFQGFFIFIFLCVVNRDAREVWLLFLTRGRYKKTVSSKSLCAHNGKLSLPKSSDKISSTTLKYSSHQDSTLKDSHLYDGYVMQEIEIQMYDTTEEEVYLNKGAID